LELSDIGLGFLTWSWHIPACPEVEFNRLLSENLNDSKRESVHSELKSPRQLHYIVPVVNNNVFYT
jgi:hypothetical protein